MEQGGLLIQITGILVQRGNMDMDMHRDSAS